MSGLHQAWPVWVKLKPLMKPRLTSRAVKMSGHIDPYLCAAGVGEHAAVLQDEQRLRHAGLGGVGVGVFRPAPPQRLQLHLAVDARKLAALLQHRLRAHVDTMLAAFRG